MAALGEQSHGQSPAVKLMSKMGIWTETLTDRSTRNLADMVIQGANQGVMDCEKARKDHPAASTGALGLLNELQQLESAPPARCGTFCKSKNKKEGRSRFVFDGDRLLPFWNGCARPGGRRKTVTMRQSTTSSSWAGSRAPAVQRYEDPLQRKRRWICRKQRQAAGRRAEPPPRCHSSHSGPARVLQALVERSDNGSSTTPSSAAAGFRRAAGRVRVTSFHWINSPFSCSITQRGANVDELFVRVFAVWAARGHKLGSQRQKQGRKRAGLRSFPRPGHEFVENFSALKTLKSPAAKRLFPVRPGSRKKRIVEKRGRRRRQGLHRPFGFLLRLILRWLSPGFPASGPQCGWQWSRIH